MTDPMLDDKALEALARAYDKEDAAQRGEPDPWKLASDDPTWRAERLACAECASEGLYGHLLSIISDIRMKSGVGAKPMLSELADTIAERITFPQPVNPAQVTDAMVSDAVVSYNTTAPGGLANHDQMRAALTAAIGAGGQAVAVKPLIWEDDHGVAGMGPYRLFKAETPLGRFVYGTDAEGSAYYHTASSGVMMVGDEAKAKRLAEAAWQKTALAEVGKFVDPSALSQPHPADERVVEADFDQWWRGSKYCQVIYPNEKWRQIALDAWNASLSAKEGR